MDRKLIPDIYLKMVDLRLRDNSWIDCLVLCFTDNLVWICPSSHGT